MKSKLRQYPLCFYFILGMHLKHRETTTGHINPIFNTVIQDFWALGGLTYDDDFLKKCEEIIKSDLGLVTKIDHYAYLTALKAGFDTDELDEGRNIYQLYKVYYDSLRPSDK